MHLSKAIAEMGPFEVISDGSAIPVLAFKVTDGTDFTVFHVSDRLRVGGGRCRRTRCRTTPPTSPCCGVVVREGFSMDLADSLVDDISAAVAFFEANPPMIVPTDSAFAH